MDVPFHKPTLTGREADYLMAVLESSRFSGDGDFNHKVQNLLKNHFDSPFVALTPSCTSALEMAAVICALRQGDEVIMPSYTFTSTANSVALMGAVPVFVDIRPDTLNIDEQKIEEAITPRTKMILPVHYAGVSAEMTAIMDIAKRHGLVVVEDAAQAIFANYKGRPVGCLGDLSAFSFHDTKNLGCGEGGALVVNNAKFKEKAEMVRDKGTNRSKFIRGEVDKYSWQTLGSSYLMSEMQAAFLLAQIEKGQELTQKRLAAWNLYHEGLADLEGRGYCVRPKIPSSCEHNGHIYHILLPDEQTREGLREHLKSQGIVSTTHFVPLHSSPAGSRYGKKTLPSTDRAARTILRLPMFSSLSNCEVEFVVDEIDNFFTRSAMS